MAVIRSNLKYFVDNNGLSVRQVARDIDYRLGSVQDMYNDVTERYPRELLSKLCVYFGCSINELLILDEE
ncbi:helix-turn-helix domain-containing protein [Paenibacillus alvei]|uniref:helix-turn-helix domain-containing protein n=1 Tax=Paenibacillus alvei TaxID=44250 RepID=UPI0013DB3D17|nr:helix-turn-helix transcriptional regulator [Paenibacillus alvei]